MAEIQKSHCSPEQIESQICRTHLLGFYVALSAAECCPSLDSVSLNVYRFRFCILETHTRPMMFKLSVNKARTDVVYWLVD